jgi:hypothetical protein
MTSDTILLPDAPAIPGLRFRHFGGASDYPKMAEAIRAASEEDGIGRADTAEAVANTYEHLTG